MVLRPSFCRLVLLRKNLLKQAQRNLGVTAVVLQQHKLDPIQELFVNKIRDYAQKSKAAGGKPVDTTAEFDARWKQETERIDKMYNAKGQDMTKFPTFSFADPTLEAVGLEPAEKGMRAPEDMPPIKDEEESPYPEPEIPYNY